MVVSADGKNAYSASWHSHSVNVFNRNIIYPFQFTQVTSGGNVMFGFPVRSVFSRLYMRYSLENVKIKDLNTDFYDPETIARLVEQTAARAAERTPVLRAVA